MKLLIIGRGKTGSLVAEVATERHHDVQVVGAAENVHCAALSKEKLDAVDVVIDFTTPHAVVGHIEACIAARKPIVVGTTGWLAESSRLRTLVEQNETALLHGANYSVGVNLFYDVVRDAAKALKHHYSGQIFERHHVHKKDAPSGTAMAIRNIVRESSGTELEITSFREGEVVGMHELVFDSLHDTIYICHDSKTRRGFAEGAVLSAEWLLGKKGFYDFKDVWRDL
jgi:4-hydroxy-tetrahydrodipicolinate reductase